MSASHNAAIVDAVAEGLMVFPSPHSPSETAERMASAVAGLGMTVVARIDHAAAASRMGLHLRPTLVLIFGNPAAGTPLMEAVPTLAIDLPMKALVWRSDAGRTWLACNDPAWMVDRHAIAVGEDGVGEVLEQMRASLVSAATQATGADPSA
ncbi:hypothetical protein TSH7_21540 [Azospirillum sp. TSH7]|jgi:uncharacterized protein (DUF302 family)|uniref:DUF302 domain-containing protein n=1 Tax=unclassified Azospirillum TaxID=2630922 RepID=UPI000D61C8A6|nr:MULTISPECIES: DUF302 domain-containing protein [unclassified Azospirillum]PWC58979.1 hypothetical protein TSH20_28755 [Azospirillum sp. TSH20]PWC59091.1 hypothetical protein TSH7_21540 [Azospirillum sp. TSH7]